MAEPTQFTYSYKELVAILIKERGIREGLWAPYVRFGMRAANLGTGDGDLVPSAIVGMLEFGIQKMDKPSNLTVDAAAVNPRTAQSKSRQGKQKTG